MKAKMENRQAGEPLNEIEITPEMIEVGVEELYCHDISEPRKDEMREAVASVFRVMVAAQELSAN